ncbi:hypothetical protein L596_028075 [Steinernema carpocapsae]|uniref:Transmembrane protein n=1 Tax=Steinernema carpocapsae TaxID=34508 RepID=A0A4U5LXH2_STECR|nr:hypothetical protein L596_028075 [Steinernema carpocapsae]
MLSPLRSKTIRKSRLLLPLTLLVNVDLNLLFCPSLKFLQSYSNLFFSLSLSSLAFPQKTPFKPRVFPPSHSFQTPARFEFSAALPHRFSSSPNGANIDVSSPEALSRSAIAHSSAMNGGAGSLFSHDHFVPSPDVVTSIVLPTILFCILMVIAMLIGINKCKQWELDKVVEMRRTRRVLERITHRLRERNFRTIERRSQKHPQTKHRRRGTLTNDTEFDGTSAVFRESPEKRNFASAKLRRRAS